MIDQTLHHISLQPDIDLANKKGSDKIGPSVTLYSQVLGSATSATLQGVLDTIGASVLERDSLGDDVVAFGAELKDASAEILDLEARTSLLGSEGLAVLEISKDLLSLGSVCHDVFLLLLQHLVCSCSCIIYKPNLIVNDIFEVLWHRYHLVHLNTNNV